MNVTYGSAAPSLFGSVAHFESRSILYRTMGNRESKSAGKDNVAANKKHGKGQDGRSTSVDASTDVQSPAAVSAPRSDLNAAPSTPTPLPSSPPPPGAVSSSSCEPPSPPSVSSRLTNEP